MNPYCAYIMYAIIRSDNTIVSCYHKESSAIEVANRFQESTDQMFYRVEKAYILVPSLLVHSNQRIPEMNNLHVPIPLSKSKINLIVSKRGRRQGQARTNLLNLLREEPTIKPKEIALRLGITKSYCYMLLKRIRQE